MKKKKQLKYKAKIGATDLKKYKDFGGYLIFFLIGYIFKCGKTTSDFLLNDIHNSGNEILYNTTTMPTLLSFIISLTIIICLFVQSSKAYTLINILTLILLLFSLIITIISDERPEHIDVITYYAGEIAFALGQSLFHVIFLLYLRFSNRVKVYYRLIT